MESEKNEEHGEEWDTYIKIILKHIYLKKFEIASL